MANSPATWERVAHPCVCSCNLIRSASPAARLPCWPPAPQKHCGKSPGEAPPWGFISELNAPAPMEIYSFPQSAFLLVVHRLFLKLVHDFNYR